MTKFVGIAEIAELANVTKQAVINWRERHPDFPEPISELKSGPIWPSESVLAWLQTRGIAVKSVSEPDIAESPRRAVSVCMMNMKGGVGKSTLAANIGWWCAYKRNKKVLLVDLDPQFNLSQYVLGNQKYEEHLESGKGTVLDIFEQATPQSVSGRPQRNVRPEDVISNVVSWEDGSRIDLVPSHLELAWTLKNPTEKAHLFATFVNKVRHKYDLILIDCPPTESILTDAAYLAGDYIVVPVKPEFLSTIGLPLLAKSLKAFRTRHEDHDIELAGIVFNSASQSKAEYARSKAYVLKQAKIYDWPLFEKEVSYSDSYPAGARAGRPIFLTEYARAWKVAEFDDVAEEFLQRVGVKND